uniref:S1 motif domain-containing protein n=1 Tax=Panagrellus redivivus TaxID=6233 RepID=A0A7E4VM58_PANRE
MLSRFVLRRLASSALKPHNFRNTSTATATSTTSATATDDFDFDDFEELISDVTSIKHDSTQTFAKLLRESKFVQLGDFDGRLVIGNIVHRVHDDLYVDFGMKFNAVVKAPEDDATKYTIGSRVLLRLRDPELSEKFLGSKRELTLLEADASLVKLLGGGQGPRRRTTTPKQESQPPAKSVEPSES